MIPWPATGRRGAARLGAGSSGPVTAPVEDSRGANPATTDSDNGRPPTMVGPETGTELARRVGAAGSVDPPEGLEAVTPEAKVINSAPMTESLPSPATEATPRRQLAGNWVQSTAPSAVWITGLGTNVPVAIPEGSANTRELRRSPHASSPAVRA
jgi:hypothetical protein